MWNDYQNRIAEFLSSRNGKISKKEIVDSVRGRKGKILVALKLLQKENKVMRTGLGTKGNPFLYFWSGLLEQEIHVFDEVVL